MRLVSAPPQSSDARRKLLESKGHERVILGGGTLIGANLPDGSNPFREHFHRYLARSRRAVAFGTGVGKLSGNPAENSWLLEWKPLLERLDYIGVRGPMSVQSLASIGIEAELLGDPACLISQGPGFWSPPREGAKVLGINLGPPRSDWAVEKAGEENFVQAISSLVQERVRDGWRIEFFAVTPADLDVIARVSANSSRNAFKIHKIYSDGHAYLHAVKHLTAFLGMKLHSVVMAMCAGVPSIMLSYAPKCQDFMRSIELDEFLIELDHVNLEILNLKLDSLLASARDVSGQITDRMASFRTRQLSRAATLRSRFSEP